MSKDIYEACSNGDLGYVITALESKIDLTKKDDFGFTPLHCAAMGSNSTDPEINLKIIKLLVEAGSNLESLGGGERTALYLLAEFSPSMTPIKYLIEKGANPDLHDEYGNHVTVNAMTEESQFFFTELTNREIEEKIEEEREPIKLNSRDWKRAKIKLSKVFEALNNKGLIALED